MWVAQRDAYIIASFGATFTDFNRRLIFVVLFFKFTLTLHFFVSFSSFFVLFFQLSCMWRKRSPGRRGFSMKTWGWRTERIMRSHWHRKLSRCSKHHKTKSREDRRKRVSLQLFCAAPKSKIYELYLICFVLCSSKKHLWRHLGRMNHTKCEYIQTLRSHSLRFSLNLSGVLSFWLFDIVLFISLQKCKEKTNSTLIKTVHILLCFFKCFWTAHWHKIRRRVCLFLQWLPEPINSCTDVV